MIEVQTPGTQVNPRESGPLQLYHSRNNPKQEHGKTDGQQDDQDHNQQQ
jgi:hypothetical protein